MVPFLLVLIGLLLAALASRVRDQVGTALALLGNWCACTGFSWYAGSVIVWQALFAIDFVTAVLLAIFTITRPPLLIVALYALQCLAHAAAGAMGLHVSATAYFDTLSALAWMQAALLGGWIGHSAYRRHFRRADPLVRGAPDQAGLAALAGEKDRL